MKSDRVSSKRGIRDGKPDALFSLTLPSPPRKSAIVDIQVQSVVGPPRIWNTRRKPARAKYLGVSDSRRPSLLLNPDRKRLKLVTKKHKALLLFVNDDGLFKKKTITYQIKVTYADGKSWTIPVVFASETTVKAPETTPEVVGVRMSAINKGISNFDAVSPSKRIKSDDIADGLFVLTIEAKNRDVVAIQIKNIGGMKALWDTVPSSRSGPIGVALVSDPVRLLNNRDGTIRIRIKERVDLNLYVADNGSIRDGRTDFQVSVTFSDGKISWCKAKRSTEEPGKTIKPSISDTPTVNFLATWMGFSKTDAVGPYSELKPDKAADTVFGLDIEIMPKRIITGIEIQSFIDPGKKWGTGATSPGAWGIAVAYQSAPRALLNKPDGSIRIPVKGRKQFYLYAANPGDIARTYQALRMIVHLADGSSYQQAVRGPTTALSTGAPGSTESKRAQGLITCEFFGIIRDLVNTTTRPGKDGYLDGMFIMRLTTVKEKTIDRIELRGSDGTIHWSSHPKPPVMLLGVAVYPAMVKLVNPKKGPLNITVKDRRTIYLYAADNSMLTNPRATLNARVIFTDKTELSADVLRGTGRPTSY